MYKSREKMWYHPGAMMYSTKSLRPGMAVRDTIRDAKGQVLVPAGVLLGDGQIAQLLQRGIPAVSIAVEESEEARDARVVARRTEILELFGETGETPELEQLRRMVLETSDAG
ncbi:MAG TPA: hypothetical protein VN931_01650 [Fibrobacteria bacterium]|nr:hypothetical protein [Fibrobacteria bacterium]